MRQRKSSNSYKNTELQPKNQECRYQIFTQFGDQYDTCYPNIAKSFRSWCPRDNFSFKNRSGESRDKIYMKSIKINNWVFELKSAVRLLHDSYYRNRIIPNKSKSQHSCIWFFQTLLCQGSISGTDLTSVLILSCWLSVFSKYSEKHMYFKNYNS